jgi:predicted MFS family arabinose efflux permease
MGTVLSLPISGVLCDTLGWESVFYVFGACGLVWFIFWACLVYDSPQKYSVHILYHFDILRNCTLIPNPLKNKSCCVLVFGDHITFSYFRLSNGFYVHISI